MRILPVVAIALLLLFSCSPETPHAPAAPVWPRLARFEPMKIPAENPLTLQKANLGRKLFSDPRLSSDRSTSCSGCHDPNYGYTMGAALPVSAAKGLNRACPSLMNAGYSKGFYWEGAPIPLEKAVLGMWKFVMVPKGDGLPTAEQVAARFNEDAATHAEFRAAFGADATPDTVAKALSSFIRTLVPADSPWVRFHGGELAALSPNAQRGYEVFDAKARCTNCHSGILLTDRLRHDIGTGAAYKTPTLLNIGRSAPYFHDNRVVTLEEAVDKMLAGGFETKTPDPQLRPATITPDERQLLLTFLRELKADASPVR
jgi:cytochrome c peroxidase